MANMAEQPRRKPFPAFFAETVARRGDERALGFIRGGELHWRTWRECQTKPLATCRGNSSGRHSGRAIASRRFPKTATNGSSPTWRLHLAGAVHVPIHVTLSGEQIAAQIADCGARLVFVSSDELLAKFGDVA